MYNGLYIWPRGLVFQPEAVEEDFQVPAGRDGVRLRIAFLMEVLAAARGDGKDVSHSPVAIHQEEHLPGEIDLDVRAAELAGPRWCRGQQGVVLGAVSTPVALACWSFWKATSPCRLTASHTPSIGPVQ